MGIDARTGRWSRLVVGAACAAAITVGLPGAALAAPAVPPAAPAAQAAARSADAAQRAHATWETHGRPTALVVIRPTSVDLVDQGRLTRRIPRAGGTLTLAGLNRYVPRNWLSITGDTARLSAAVVLTPTVTLDVGAPVTTLQLAGGATAPEAASISTGSGGLTLHGATVTSVDRTSGQAMAPGPGRPFILVSPGGRFTATDATLSDLGTAPRDGGEQADVEDRPGLDFHAGSTGSLVRTSLLRNGTGLRLDGSQGVHLEGVTVSGSAGTGLVLRGDRGTTMSGVRAEHNGAYGVQVTGPSTDRPITGIVTTGNGSFGIGLDNQTGTHVTAVSTSGDGGGGLELTRSRDVTVSALTAADEPAGVFTHVNNANVVLDQLTVTGGRRGVVVEKTTDGLTVQASTIQGASVAGIADDGKNVALHGVAVRDSRTALRVERGADGVTAGDLTISGGQDGVVAAPGSTRMVLQELRADGLTGTGVRSASPDARILGGAITGGATGIDVAAATSISGTSIRLTDQGIRAASTGLVHADDVVVDAVSVGIDTGDAPVLLTRSQVHALEAVRGTLTAEGTNDLSLPPLNLLGAVGIPLVLLAVSLQVIAALRGRRFGGDTRRIPPALPGASGPAAEARRPSPALPDAPAHAA
jgi:Right handed beta helix region